MTEGSIFSVVFIWLPVRDVWLYVKKRCAALSSIEASDSSPWASYLLRDTWSCPRTSPQRYVLLPFLAVVELAAAGGIASWAVASSP